jgi:hypothetical protein
MTSTVLLISGMRDNGSRESVVESLERVSGVRRVHVNLYRARATIVHEISCTIAELTQAVMCVGFTAVADPKATST